jgi:hypothetical protein
VTAIAYRAGTMAADTKTVHEYVKVDETKIFKAGGHLIGVMGEVCPSNADLSRWFLAAPDKHFRPEFKDHRFALLIVNPKGKLSILHHTGRFYPVVHQRFWAIGAGAECCMAAMEAGATAEQAVRAAIKWQKDCGGRVTVRKLK